MITLQDLNDLRQRLGENPEYKAIYIGMRNFLFKNKKATKLALQRFEDSCKKCEFLDNETNEILQFEDEIKAFENKKCNDCGCCLSIKLRQSKKKCNKWEI